MGTDHGEVAMGTGHAIPYLKIHCPAPLEMLDGLALNEISS